MGGWRRQPERYGLDTVVGVSVSRDGDLMALARGPGGQTGLIEVTRPHWAMMGLRLAPNTAGPWGMVWDLRHGETGGGLERFDAEGRLIFSSQWGEPVYFEYGDGTDGTPAGALKRMMFGDPYSPSRYTDFLYDTRGKLAALRDEDGYETRIRIDGRGDLVLAQSPGGDFRIYLYDEAHRLRAVIGDQGFAEVVAYNEAGMVSEVSGMRGFLRAAPEETWRLLNRLSPDTGWPWSPVSGFVAPVLVGLSDYLEDLCDTASDCDDGLPLTLDWCELGFCRHEMLGTFPPPVDLEPHAPCTLPGGCAPASPIPSDCRPDGEWVPDCDDGDPATLDLCLGGRCANPPVGLPLAGLHGFCDPAQGRSGCFSMLATQEGFDVDRCALGCTAEREMDEQECREHCAKVLADRARGCLEAACLPPVKPCVESFWEFSLVMIAWDCGSGASKVYRVTDEFDGGTWVKAPERTGELNILNGSDTRAIRPSLSTARCGSTGIAASWVGGRISGNHLLPRLVLRKLLF